MNNIINVDSEKKINLKQLNTFLDSVNYKKHTDDTGKYKIKVNETVDVVNVEEQCFSIRLVRKVEFDSQKLFSLEVSFIIKCDIDDNDVAYFEKDLEKVSKFADKNKFNIVASQSVCSQASLIIAQITSFNNLNPIILPPHIFKNS